MSIRRDGPRFLIGRMSAIGDTVLTLPVACALRDAYPNCFIAWVVEEKSAAMVLEHQEIDEVVVIPRGWYVSPRGILQMARRLRPLRIETAIDCQGLTKSALACLLSGAPHRIGYRGQHGGELSRWLNNHLVPTECTHVIDRALELLRPLGVTDPRVRWDLPLDDASVQFADDFTRRSGLLGGFAVINPGASCDARLWEIGRYAPVARYLRSTYGLRTLVVWGGSRERAWAEQIVGESGGDAVLAPPTSLIQLASLIARGRMFISADSGPLHIAVAVGTPSIGLHGTTRPEDSGAYGRPHVSVQIEYQGGTRRQRRRAENTAMRKIGIDDVCNAADRLLGQAAVAAA